MARDEVQEIRLLLERINNAWLKNQPDAIPAALEDCFHESMVIRGPGFQTLGEGGREACARSYADFMRNASVLDCSLSEPVIHLAGGLLRGCPAPGRDAFFGAFRRPLTSRHRRI